MSLKLWQFIAIILAALTAGMGFRHLMDLPARIMWDQSRWLENIVTGGHNRMFGTVGASIVVATCVVMPYLAYRLRHHDRAASRLTAVSAACFILALTLWWAFVVPVNIEMDNWIAGPFPANWMSWRVQWEVMHALTTLIQMIGLGALLKSVVEGAQERLAELSAVS
ncbi:MAG: hypothetical protein HY659_07530 [Rhizobiales bacterium]|nr:hypothetical protein [Hyphomicrobiales bacterium]